MEITVQFTAPRLMPRSVRLIDDMTLQFRLDWGGNGADDVINLQWLGDATGWKRRDPGDPNRPSGRIVDNLEFLSWEYELGREGVGLPDGTPSFGHVIQSLAKQPGQTATFWLAVLDDGGFAAR